MKNNVWDNFNYYGFVLTDKALTEAALKNIDQRVDALHKKHEPEFKTHFHLQPLKSIHLHSNFMADVPGHGNSDYVLAFVVVAGFILIVACINFMNLSTARSARRAMEVGLRKVSGATRAQLIGQFLAESLIIAFISLVIAVLVAFVSLRFVNDIAGKQLTLNLLDWKLISVPTGIALATGLVAGSYPALVLSGFVPAKVLKREVTSGSGGVIFRNVLVVVQFVVSVVLLAGTAIVYQQLNFIQNKSVGYTKENLVYFEMKGALWNDLSALKSRLLQNRFTEHYTFSTHVPTNMASGTIYLDWQGKDKDNQVLFAHMAVDENFVDVMGMKMIAGRDFSKDVPADTINYIVNEAALRVMDMNAESAIGSSFTLWDRKGVIVGVVQDFNFKPLQKSVEPMVLRYNSWGGVVIIRTEPKNTEETLSSLAAICKELNPAYPFVYKYVDQDLANLYINEKQIGKLFNVFAGLAIFISCLGLYGLSAFVAEQRTKEIGIRKALGASIPHIVQLLSTRFLIPIVIAIVIAAPIAFYVMDNWLQGFAYRVNFGWTVFVSAGIIALMTGFLTISFECIKAARMNPVKSLRTE
ncbi:MAG: FtsX-like permease family protein [Chryseolinea sp.]